MKLTVHVTTCALLTAIVATSAIAQRQQKTSPPCIPGKYQLVESRGIVRVVVITPSCRNLEAMKTLGDKFRVDFAAERIIIVMVFDSQRAAGMYDRMLESSGSLGAAEDRFYDKHNVGNYSKNTNTSNHQYIITLQGADGPEVVLNY